MHLRTRTAVSLAWEESISVPIAKLRGLIALNFIRMKGEWWERIESSSSLI